jgi:hypothetical protein
MTNRKTLSSIGFSMAMALFAASSTSNAMVARPSAGTVSLGPSLGLRYNQKLWRFHEMTFFTQEPTPTLEAVGDREFRIFMNRTAAPWTKPLPITGRIDPIQVIKTVCEGQKAVWASAIRKNEAQVSLVASNPKTHPYCLVSFPKKKDVARQYVFVSFLKKPSLANQVYLMHTLTVQGSGALSPRREKLLGSLISEVKAR